ncbi:MAG: matrixin family metalloprotease [Chloracidobacterium sp.]|nr:matrixin family metalloprotease [Chloracidobacterium sp.]
MKVIRILILGSFILYCFSTVAFGSTNTVAPAAGMAAPARSDLQRLRWKSKTVKIAISSSLTRTSSNIKYDSDVAGAIRRSLKAWTSAANVDLQIEFSDKQSVSLGGAAGDGISLITIAQSPENVLFFSKDAESVSAKTRVFFNRKGFITEADIVLNPFQQFSTDGTFGTFDLESTLTHEIGHLLGLHHSGVLSSTMSESFAKNGTMGVADLSPRTLSESDIAAIRELYGSPDELENCCGVISGKLSTAAGKPGKGLQVWAEETVSGRVMAQTETFVDGTFRLGGLPVGEYSVYWRSNDLFVASVSSELGNVSIEAGESKVLNEKISLRSSDVLINYLGLNGQLADYGISLKRARAYVVSIGGKDLASETLKLRSSSPYIKLVRLSPTSQEFSEGIYGISFMVMVDPEIEAGQYSIFVNDNGSESSLVGAINIE